MFSRIFGRLFALAILCVPFAVGAEEINAFHVTATVSKDRNVVFEEEITYDFGSLDRHGIYRFIPEKTYRDGVTYRYRFEVLSVTRDGLAEPYTVSHSGGRLQLKIGSPNIEITGKHVYKITYQTDRAITFFENQDELYWDVTGNEWEVGIEEASMTIRLPDGGSLNETVCYTGHAGSEEKDCQVVASSGGALVKSTRVFRDGEGMTVAYVFPKGLITPPTSADAFWMTVRDNGVLFFPIMAFIIMIVLWWKKGRDPSLASIIPQYEPPRGMRPGVMSRAMRESFVPNEAITATILDLARRGYLHIKVDEEKTFWGGKNLKYTFIKKPKPESEPPLSAEEMTLWQGLFTYATEQTIEDLKEHKFYYKVSSAREDIEKEVARMKLFDASPSTVRGAYIGVAIVVVAVLGTAFFAEPLGFVALLLTGIIIAVFGWFMPRRTAAGRKLLEEILGFKMFLSVTEKDRMSFHNAPERKPEQFQELLPYAVIFGVEKQWAAQFKDMHLKPPDYIEGSASSSFGIDSIASSLSGMGASAAGAAYSVPSSGSSGSSGGSSGGGGGGGGGGSW
ncbi:DUF2207 domain-containing protein [Patescibacteria group bacterium]|nr:DUF2207 domain-containing protein [Patescibacteria group bacterium]